MKTTINLILFLALAWNTANAQVGIGTTTPKDDAALDIESTTKGFLPPRMDNAQRDAISSPAEGLVIYNTETDCVQWYDGSFWYDGCTGSEAPDPLPGNITLEEISAYFIASADDTDYLDGSSLPNNTTEAQLPGTAADDEADAVTTETAINIQGTLTTTGVTINIPYEVSSGSVDLTAFSQTITIPADYTENNTATDITFSYPSQTGLSGTGVIPATLQAVGSNLDVIQFDLNSGLGANYLGFLLGKFVYALDSAGTIADFEVRGIPGIPDKNIGDGVHDFVYLPVISPGTGKTWLNNNLGADYANINDTNFNPAQQANSATDEKAYGSMFQWGRLADGHEIVNWSSSSSGTRVNNTTTTSPSSSDDPSTDSWIAINGDWRSPSNDNLWQGSLGINNPCPNGFRVATDNEWQAEIDDNNLTTAPFASGSFLAITNVGRVAATTGSPAGTGSWGRYWTSNGNASDANWAYFSDSSLAELRTNQRKAEGHAVRCIQN